MPDHPPNTKEMLIGFDAREMWLTMDDLYTAEVRRWYLLRNGLEKVLSADQYIWQSLFSASRREQWGLNPINLPYFYGLHGLWDNLEKMEAALASGEFAAGKPCRIIAVSWLTNRQCFSEDVPEDLLRLCTYAGPYDHLTDPSIRQEHWHLLGFDVTDGSLESALSNHACRQEDYSSWRERWGGDLNKTHLFRRLENAFAFREACNRSPEYRSHRPYFVVALWAIRDIAA